MSKETTGAIEKNPDLPKAEQQIKIRKIKLSRLASEIFNLRNEISKLEKDLEKLQTDKKNFNDKNIQKLTEHKDERTLDLAIKFKEDTLAEETKKLSGLEESLSELNLSEEEKKTFSERI